MKRSTIADVARLAKVSPATVSYVLNGKSDISRISKATRKRVLEAAKELGYWANPHARSLRTQRTELVALAVQDIANPFYSLVSVAVQLKLEESGHDLLVYNLGNQPGREQKFLDLVKRRQPDGVLIFAWSLSPKDITSIVTAGVSVVCLSPPKDYPGVDTVTFDDTEGARQAVLYLQARGHSRIAHISGPLSSLPGQRRLNGYRAALEQCGIPFEPQLVKQGDFMQGSGRATMLELLRLPQPPTAVFVANDVMALDAMLVAQEYGHCVPDDVAIVGFDDIPTATLVRPALTTVRQDPWIFGEASARCLLTRLVSSSEQAPQHITLSPELVVRDSA